MAANFQGEARNAMKPAEKPGQQNNGNGGTGTQNGGTQPTQPAQQNGGK